MNWLTEDAVMICDHGGRVTYEPVQTLVTIAGRRPLVAKDPEDRRINFCPNANPVIGLRPCLKTMKVDRGYSTLVRIQGRAVCLSDLQGLTDGSPPGLAAYKVVEPGQTLVQADA